MLKRSVRVGRISYTNVWPIYYYFPVERFLDRAEFISQVPSTLNKAMAAGEIDMGPISSFAYGEFFDKYVLFPDLSVSAWGPVKSILLFHRKPLEEIASGTFALINTSATSVNLLKILLQKFYGGSPSYFYSSPPLEKMIENADGALLIGDDAIQSSWADAGYLVTDLGAEWNRLTGQWMSFAVWAIRKGLAEEQPDLVSGIYHGFLEGKSKGLREPDEMIRRAAAEIGGTEAYWRAYFSQLCHDFGPAQRQGLSLYYRYAWELGLLKAEVPIRIWNDKTVMQVKE